MTVKFDYDANEIEFFVVSKFFVPHAKKEITTYLMFKDGPYLHIVGE